MPESFTVTRHGLELLQRLVGKTIDQLVWDLNAVYFVAGKSTIKVETAAAAPIDGKPNAEVMYITVENERSRWRRFRVGGQRGYWYKVLATNKRIDNIELARTTVRLPSEVPQFPEIPVPQGEQAFVADAGILVSVEGAVVPAIQLHNWFGYSMWAEPRLFTRDEALAELDNCYHLVPVATAA